MPHPLHEIGVAGRSIRWRESGAPSTNEGRTALPLVLLHAFPLSAAMWAEQLDAFQGRRVIAPDTRGFRAPDAPTADSPGEPGMQDLADDLERLLDALAVGEAVIGGLSMGGYIAFALFRRASARFKGLVLANTKASADSEEAREGRRKMRALVERGGSSAVAADMLPKLLGPTTQGEQPDLARHVRTLIEANSTEAIRGAIGAMLARPDSRPLLASISCPTLILAGDEDTLIPREAAEEMHAGIRGSELVVLPRCGHLANLEQPKAFNDALGRFLRSLA